MHYLAYTKRIQYPEKKCIRTRLDTCKNSCYSSLQPIRFGENRRFEARIIDETSRNLCHNSLSYAPTQNHSRGGGDVHTYFSIFHVIIGHHNPIFLLVLGILYEFWIIDDYMDFI